MKVTSITTHPSVIEALARTAPLTPDGKYNDYWNKGKEQVICPVTGHPILRYSPTTKTPPEQQQTITGRLRTLLAKIVNFFSF